MNTFNKFYNQKKRSQKETLKIMIFHIMNIELQNEVFLLLDIIVNTYGVGAL